MQKTIPTSSLKLGQVPEATVSDEDLIRLAGLCEIGEAVAAFDAKGVDTFSVGRLTVDELRDGLPHKGSGGWIKVNLTLQRSAPFAIDIGMFGARGLTVTRCRAGSTIKSMSCKGMTPSSTWSPSTRAPVTQTLLSISMRTGET